MRNNGFALLSVVCSVICVFLNGEFFLESCSRFRSDTLLRRPAPPRRVRPGRPSGGRLCGGFELTRPLLRSVSDMSGRGGFDVGRVDLSSFQMDRDPPIGRLHLPDATG